MKNTNDARINAITFNTELRQSMVHPPLTIVVDDDLKPVKYMLESIAWGHFDRFAQQMLDHLGFHNEDGAILFGDAPDLEPEIEPFEGVMFVDFFENRVIMSVPTLWRLLDRFFHVVIDIANERKLDVLADPLWQVFLKQAERMKQLAHQAP